MYLLFGDKKVQQAKGKTDPDAFREENTGLNLALTDRKDPAFPIWAGH